MKVTVVEQASSWFPRERGFSNRFDDARHNLGMWDLDAKPARDEHVVVRGVDFIVTSISHTAGAPGLTVFVTNNGRPAAVPVDVWRDERTMDEIAEARAIDKRELKA